MLKCMLLACIVLLVEGIMLYIVGFASEIVL